MTIKKCEFCKKDFIPKRSDQRFCCEKCRRRGYYRDHPEVFRKAQKKYYQKNFVKIRLDIDRWQEEHKEHLQQYRKNYYKNYNPCPVEDEEE